MQTCRHMVVTATQSAAKLMAEACDKLHLFFTFSCFTQMLAISLAPHTVIHHHGATFPILLLPSRVALCLSTASHKSAAFFSSWKNDRSPPPSKAEDSHCWRLLPHQFPLCCSGSQHQPFISSHAWDRQGRPCCDGFSEHVGLQRFPQQGEFGCSHSCPDPEHVVLGCRGRLCIWFTMSVPRWITLMRFLQTLLFKETYASVSASIILFSILWL